MRLFGKDRWKVCNVLLILCLVFQMSVVVTPNYDPVNSGYPLSFAKSDAFKYTPIPFKNGQRLYLITALNGNEIINEAETYLTIDRNNLGTQGLFFRFFKFMIPFAGLGVLVLCFGYVINKKKQHKSILTILLGGHAPPEYLYLRTI